MEPQNLPSLLSSIESSNPYFVLEDGKVAAYDKTATSNGISWSKGANTNLNDVISHLFSHNLKENIATNENLEQVSAVKEKLSWMKAKVEKHNSRWLVRLGDWLGLTKKWDTAKLDDGLAVSESRLQTLRAPYEARALTAVTKQVSGRLANYKFVEGQQEEALFRTSPTAEMKADFAPFQEFANPKMGSTDAVQKGMDTFFLNRKDKNASHLVALLKNGIQRMSEEHMKHFVEVKSKIEGKADLPYKSLPKEDKEFLRQYVPLMIQVIEKDWMPRIQDATFEKALDKFMVAEPLSTKMAFDLLAEQNIPATQQNLDEKKEWMKQIIRDARFDPQAFDTILRF